MNDEDDTFAAEVDLAWFQLRTHPALRWVPPMWRSMAPTTAPAAHELAAVEHNLQTVVEHAGDHLAVFLSTGPLCDRHLADGVDPSTPDKTTDPSLSVSAPTFQHAVLALRDAVHRTYGFADNFGPGTTWCTDGPQA